MCPDASDEKFQRTSTPLFCSQNQVDSLNRSYSDYIKKLHRHPKRFVVYGTNYFLPGILCGMLAMDTASDGKSQETVDKNRKNCEESNQQTKKKQKTTTEIYKVT